MKLNRNWTCSRVNMLNSLAVRHASSPSATAFPLLVCLCLLTRKSSGNYIKKIRSAHVLIICNLRICNFKFSFLSFFSFSIQTWNVELSHIGQLCILLSFIFRGVFSFICRLLMLLDFIPLSLFCFLSAVAGAAVFIICASLVFVRLSVCLSGSLEALESALFIHCFWSTFLGSSGSRTQLEQGRGVGTGNST